MHALCGFEEIPALDEMTSDVSGNGPHYTQRHIMPWHARRYFSIYKRLVELSHYVHSVTKHILFYMNNRKLPTIFEILDTRIGIVLTRKYFAIVSLSWIVRQRVAVCVVPAKA